MVSSQQANDLNRKQREVDKPFGMLAVEAGLMTEEQVQTLLKVQKETKLTLAKAIADLKLLDIDSLNRALHTFKAHNPQPARSDGPVPRWFASRTSDS